MNLKRKLLFWIENLKIRKMEKEKYDSLINHHLKMKADAKAKLEGMPRINGGYVAPVYTNRKREINKTIAQCDKQIRIVRKLRREVK